MATPRLLHAVACVCGINSVITLIIYRRVVAQDDAATSAAGAATAEQYFANHGGMEALLREKFGTRMKHELKPKIHDVSKRSGRAFAAVNDGRTSLAAAENQQKQQKQQIPASRRRRRRFPAYGTPEFSALCPWTDDTATSTAPRLKDHESRRNRQNCTFLVRPSSGSNEGIAAWTAQVVTGHLRVAQTSCRLLIDYGKYHVDVSSVVRPYPGLEDRAEGQRYNWTTPLQFQCDLRDGCYDIGRSVESDLARVPSYRYAYLELLPKYRLRAEDYAELRNRLNGFQHEIGFACSLGKLFHLSPTADQYEPRLYTDILPALRDEKALVVALYIRTGFTDRQAIKDEKKEGPASDTMKTGATNSATRRNVKCALALEKEFLSHESNALQGSGEVAMAKRVVWMVVSDSTAAKDWIKAIYGNKTVEFIRSDGAMQPIKRKIMFTGSRGAHTKPRHDPSTADFADAFIDWYLIAESDVVVTTGGLYSFGITAGLRTSRPIYGAKESNATCVKEGDGVECSCTPLYDASERIDILLDKL